MAFSVDNLGAKGNFLKNDSIPYQKKNSFDGSHKRGRKNSENDLLPNSFHKIKNNHRNNDAADTEEVLEYFNKKYQLKPPDGGWNLPPETDMFRDEIWTIDEFMTLKSMLNKVKNKLNHYNLEDWHRHTRAMNKAGDLLWTVKKNFSPEFVTQAWVKFYEICSSYNFVCQEALEQNYLNSVHLCEAPGAFITSLNHYLKLNHPDIKWDWISTTLNPYYEGNPLSIMINDDRFILHTLDHWKFGEDYTGNLMDINNMLYLTKAAQKMGPVLMITADGSIDCQSDPGEQELIVSPLIYCEVVIALHILSVGGNFVVKMFTMYEEMTICLMYLLACSFESVSVFKPASSKEGNSENYVVCLNYRGVEALKPWLCVLRAHFGSVELNKAMFRLCDIPKDFIDQLYECATKFKNYQVEVIERNIFLFETISNQQSVNRTKRLKFALAEEFIRRYNLRALNSKEDEIVGEDKLKKTETPNVDKRCDEGSFNDKIEREKMPPLKKMKVLLEDVQKMQLKWEFDEDIIWIESPLCEEKFNVIVGKSVTSVRSSKFCSGKLLKIRNEVRSLVRENFPNICKTNDVSKSNGYKAVNELSAPVKNIIEKSFSMVDGKVRVLNYKEHLWELLESGRNEMSESSVFFDIMDEMEEEMWRGYTLIIQGYPMLTQFTVGVIYLMSHMFEKVGFVRPTGPDFAVIFQEYRSISPKRTRFVKDLASMVDMVGLPRDKSVLALIPIQELIFGHSDFYSCVVAVNNLCVKEQICDIVNRVNDINSIVDIQG